MIDCLDGLIGLTDIDCECVVEERPEDYNVSSSGYFLTDMEWGIPLKSIAYTTPDCFSGGTIWEVMQKAIEDAQRDFCADLEASLYKKYESKFNKFYGWIGQEKASGQLSVSQNHAGVKLQMPNYSSGCFVIEGIQLGLTCDTPTDINIRDAECPTEIIATIPGDTLIAGKFTEYKLENPIELPMQVDGCRPACYLIEYEMPSSCNPLNAKFACCGNKPAWKSFIKAAGFSTNDLEKVSANGKYTNGLRIKGYAKCKALDWICTEIEVGGFSLKNIIARTIQMKAVTKLINLIHNTGKINFTTLITSEQIMGQAEKCNGGYCQNIQFICENLPTQLCDCFKCKSSKRGAKKATMF